MACAISLATSCFGRPDGLPLTPMWPEMSFCVGLHVVLTARGTVTSCIPITVSLLLSLFPFFLGFNGRCGLHTANLSMLNLGTVQLFSRL
jgi:hypothetical protein